MILAELHGKIPSRIEHKEDILTSNVFSFFKYSNRKYLRDYLSDLGLTVSIEDAEKAEFQFWPRYEDGTEPDVVIICGKYYILIEAKLFSDFSSKIIDIETNEIEEQLERESRMGKMSAQNADKKLVLMAITSEYFKNGIKYKKIETLGHQFIWTNWQFVAKFMLVKIEDTKNLHDLLYLKDLYELLVYKRLRSFMNFSKLKHGHFKDDSKIIFYDYNTSVFKGEFTGFMEVLTNFPQIINFSKFYSGLFHNQKSNSNQPSTNKIFFNGND